MAAEVHYLHPKPNYHVSSQQSAVSSQQSAVSSLGLGLVCAIALCGNADAQIYDNVHDTLSTIAFRQNAGQAKDSDGNVANNVSFYSENSPLQYWILDDGSLKLSQATTDTIRSIQMAFVGEAYNPNATVTALTTTSDAANYYLAHTPNGVTGVQAYRAITCEDVFTGVDVQYYAGSISPKMAFIFAPNSDPSDLQLQFFGQDSLDVDLMGMLKLYLGQVVFRFDQAIAYQLDTNGYTLPISWSPLYDVINGVGVVHFDYFNYDPSLPLIFQIGPSQLGGGGGGGGSDNLDWSTMIGTDAVTNPGGDYGNAMDAADDGSVFVAGNTPDPTYPTSNGALPYQGGFWDAYVMRFRYAPGNSALDARRDWTTYYGGSAQERFSEIAVSKDNTRIYCVGWTNSTDFVKEPPTDPMDGTYFQSDLKGATDGILVTLNSTNGFKQRAMYYGGDGDDMLTTIAENSTGRFLFMAGTTNSTTGSSNNCNAPAIGFPLCDPSTNSYAQASNAGGQDCFLVALEDYKLKWSTFYGSGVNDVAYDLVYKAPGNAADQLVLVGTTNGTVPATSAPDTRVALPLVGTTNGTVPATGATGLFQQSGNTQENGFIATFKLGSSLGQPAWATNLQGLKGLYAASIFGDKLFVLGVASGSTQGASNCGPTLGAVSICDPGGSGIWCTANNSYQDHYLAEFTLPSGQLTWSTLFGGAGDEYADMSRFLYLNYNPFGTHRFYHLANDADGNLYMLGITEQIDQLTPAYYPTFPAPPFYYSPSNPIIGNQQSDLVLACFLADHRLYWASMFGGGFNHVADQTDQDKSIFGSDYGHGLAVVDGEALYWSGTTGGWGYDLRYPYPNSYWEPTLSYGASNDAGDAFGARMSLQNLNVSVAEPSRNKGGLLAWPNPVVDIIQVSAEALDSRSHLDLVDGLGQIVAQGKPGAAAVSVRGLAPGIYLLRCVNAEGICTEQVKVVVK